MENKKNTIKIDLSDFKNFLLKNKIKKRLKKYNDKKKYNIKLLNEIIEENEKKLKILKAVSYNNYDLKVKSMLTKSNKMFYIILQKDEKQQKKIIKIKKIINYYYDKLYNIICEGGDIDV